MGAFVGAEGKRKWKKRECTEVGIVLVNVFQFVFIIGCAPDSECVLSEGILKIISHESRRITTDCGLWMGWSVSDSQNKSVFF